MPWGPHGSSLSVATESRVRGRSKVYDTKMNGISPYPVEDGSLGAEQMDGPLKRFMDTAVPAKANCRETAIPRRLRSFWERSLGLAQNGINRPWRRSESSGATAMRSDMTCAR